MQVQIAIVGDYMENYGAHEWDGTGVCPQFWRAKGLTKMPIVCAVDPKDIGLVMIDVAQAAEAMSVNNEHEWVSYNSFAVYPSKLRRSEFIEFDYKEYDMIKSISRAEIDAFLARKDEFYSLVSGDPFEPQVTIPEPLPYEEYDIM